MTAPLPSTRPKSKHHPGTALSPAAESRQTTQKLDKLMPPHRLPLTAFTKIGQGVARPEGVIGLPDNRVITSHHHAAIATFTPTTPPTFHGQKYGTPNGIALDAQNRIIIANFGVFDQHPGPLERYDPSTSTREILVESINGHTLTSCNFPVLDNAGNIFCSHSTFAPTWPHALDRRPDGFIFVHKPDGTTEILAENLRFPNGLALNAAQTHLYVTQTSNADILRFPLLPGPKLGPPEPYGPKKLGLVMGMKINPKLKLPGFITRFLGYTDGLGFDTEGNLYVTLPAAHMVIAITPTGQRVVIAHDPSARLLQNPTNIAWGGPGLNTLLIASLSADYILAAPAPVPGQKLAFP